MANNDVLREIQNRMLDAHVEIARLEAGLRRKIERLLADLEREVVDALQSADPTELVRPLARRAATERMIEEISALIGKNYAEIAKSVREDLSEVVQLSSAMSTGAMNASLQVDLVSGALTKAEAALVTKELLIEGAPNEDWWRMQASGMADRFAREMRVGMSRGETMSQLVQRVRGKPATPGKPALRGVMSLPRQQAQTIVRTAVMTAANKARQQLYADNADLVRGFRWVATLDPKTCLVCAEYDGKEWDANGDPVGGHRFPYPGPVMHPSCRCTTEPLLVDYNDLMKNRKVAAILNRLHDRGAGMRAAMEGPVPGNLTYEEWLRKQTKERQIDILGPTKWDLWSKGKLGFSDLVSMDGRPLTVDQLRERV